VDDSDQPVRPFLTFGPIMRALLLVSLCFACIGIYGLLGFLMPVQMSKLSAEHPDFLGILQGLLIFALPAIIYVNVFPAERFGYFRLNKRVALLTVLFATAGLVVLIPAMDFGMVVIRQSITNPELITYIETLEKSSADMLQMQTFGSFLFCLFAHAFVPAVCEELLFRGGIQQILMERSRNGFFPIVAASFLFTLFHANPTQIPFIFISGLVLGFAFYRTRSLRITIIMHFFFNGTSILLEYLAQHNPAVRSWMPGQIVAIICVISSALLLFLFWKKTTSARSK
jgi:membrane protease YdiL (CAAX protease family)